MDANILKGKWLQLKGSVREKWGQLTDDDVDKVGGSAERLVGLIQERYGYASFVEMLKDAESRGLVALEYDQPRGNYKIRAK